MAIQPQLIVGTARKVPVEGLSRPLKAPAVSSRVPLGLIGIGSLLSVAVVLDLSVLWLLQSVNSAQWEFMAAVNTLEAYPGFLLGFALILVGLYMRSPSAMLGVR